MKKRKNLMYVCVLAVILIISTLFSLFCDRVTETLVDRVSQKQEQVMDQDETDILEDMEGDKAE